MSTRTAVIYTRVSSREQEQEGFSLDAQSKLLREYADRNGLQIVQAFEDVETAKTVIDHLKT
jgi:DNA invertase Pin-like site-specific DNA recombinase